MSEGTRAEPSQRALRVLLLEDSPFDAELLASELMAAYPHAVLEHVHDERGFLQALQAGSFDVILSDYELGGYTGGQALALAREHAPALPFIFVSGVIGEDNAVELLKLGATDYVSKGRLARLPVVVERAMREVAERGARKVAESRLRQAKDEAERANRAKDRFMAVLSHELRTPLASMSFAAHLLEKVATVPAKYAELLPTIRRSIAMETRLIDDLLDISAITNGKLSVKPEVLDMREVLDHVLETSQEQSAHKEVRITCVRAAEPLWVVGDDARLQQVLSNVVRNAIKFSPSGTTVRLETATDADGHLLVSCSDEGVGMKPEALGRIFEAFEQADDEVKRHYGGLGLGLAIARHLALQHRGTLSAHSDGPGHGSTFTLRLPLLPAAAAAVEPGVPAPAPAPMPPGRRVLLVEDNPAAAETLRLCLEDMGWLPTHVATCAAAIRASAADTFDIVLTDLGLPDGSGVDIGRAFGARMPVVALTGYGTVGDISETTEAGFVAHLVKPAAPALIHETLSKAMLSWRPAA